MNEPSGNLTEADRFNDMQRRALTAEAELAEFRQNEQLRWTHAEFRQNEQLRWTHGTLPTRTLERILADVLMDLWHDCYRRDAEIGVRYRMFCEKVVSGLYAATGTKFRVE